MDRRLRNTAAAGLAAWLVMVTPAMGQGGAAGASNGTTPGVSRGTAAGAASGTTQGANSAGAASAIAMPHGIVPNRSELPVSAFNKLDSENKGYVTREDVQQLGGFDSAFGQADQNRDGRLNASEFNNAWAIYTGNTR